MSTMKEINPHQDTIQALRAFANLLEANPDLPSITGSTFIAHTDRDGIAAAARMTSWQKKWSERWLTLAKDFGAEVRLHVYTDRGAVCRKVITGMRVVPAEPEQVIPATPEREEPIEEWVCDEVALLAERSR